MGKELKVAESVNESATRGLMPEQVESFKANGSIGPFDLYPEDEAPLQWNQAMLSGFGDSISLDYHGSVLVSGTDKWGHNRLHEKNLNGFPFPKVETNGR